MAGELQKAMLQEVKANKKQEPVGTAVEVQFNPATLKLKLSNKTSGGRSSGRSARQHNGANATTLSMDLIFDSADDFRGSEPVSVREKTAIVEKYVLPKKDKKDKPPLLQFQWDELIFTGIVESLNIDFEHFAPNGTPLRAKCSLSIKEQKPEYQYLKEGEGSRNNDNASPPLMRSINQPGMAGSRNKPPANRTTRALEGETAAELASRMGLDPAAWRGLDVDLSAGLTLEAGVEVGFNSELSINAGVGLSMGISSGVDVSLEASLGLDVDNGKSSTAYSANGKKSSAGLAIAAAGGVATAIETVKDNKSSKASRATQSAFSSPGKQAVKAIVNDLTDAAASLVSQQKPVQKRTPLSQSGNLSHSEVSAATEAPLPVTADSRSISFGFGVPLKPVYPTLKAHSQPRICRQQASQLRQSEGEPMFRNQPTISPWQQLPRHKPGRVKADSVAMNKRINPCRFIQKRDE
jgi:hypothetical protein